MCKKKDNYSSTDWIVSDVIIQIIVWLVAIVACVAIWWWGASYTREYALNHALTNDENNIVGLFGDSFGAVNALISALAFAGVLVTFWLQRKELDLQRQELKAQREEFTQQNKTLKLQRFENTFFHMMELQQQIVNDLHIRVSSSESQYNFQTRNFDKVRVDKSVSGRQAISFIYDNCVFGAIQNQGIRGYIDAPNRELLDHYFRHLYTILRYVDETNAFAIEDETKADKDYEWRQKYHYTTIIRSTLSRSELLMLYYNGLSEFGRDKLKPLMEKYAILNNMDRFSLSMSKEYIEKISGAAVDQSKMIQDFNITGRDFEYYLTEEKNDVTKYHIDAFGLQEEDREMSKLAIRQFQVYMEEVARRKEG